MPGWHIMQPAPADYKDAGVFLDLWCFCLRAGYFVVVYMKGRLIIGKIF